MRADIVDDFRRLDRGWPIVTDRIFWDPCFEDGQQIMRYGLPAPGGRTKRWLHMTCDLRRQAEIGREAGPSGQRHRDPTCLGRPAQVCDQPRPTGVAIMKLWVLSDLHVSRRVARTATMSADAMPVADVAVVAGDVCEGVEDAITFLGRTITLKMPVIFTLGNHEFYGEYLQEARRIARAWTDRTSNLHLLDDNDVELGGVRFIGSTLWTDYHLYSHGEPARQVAAMRTAERMLSDHNQILMEPKRPGYIARNFSPHDALELHETSVAFLDRTLGRPYDGPSVVVSHHAPHPKSVHASFAGDGLTPAFVSNLSTLIDRRQPSLWIHGHTHQPVDYLIKPRDGRSTRILCNPRGYLNENSAFDARLVVEV